MARVQLARRDREVLGAWKAETLDEMIAALQDVASDARLAGHDPDTVYCEKRRVTLVSETLSDGSEVLNIHFFDGE